MENRDHLGYDPHRPDDRREMLEAIGVGCVDDLFSQIPEALHLRRQLVLPRPLNEWELMRHMRDLASRNSTTLTHTSLLGGGAYEHYIPAVVHAIASRGEYLTAYTPYQPEMSQGLLRVLHDYQIAIGRLLGLPAVNCSVYDGATAVAEAAWMACGITGRRRIAVAQSMWPEYRQVLSTYMGGRGVEVVLVPSEPQSGRVSIDDMRKIVASKAAAGFIVQTPNMYGVIEPVARFAAECKASDAVAVVSCNPMMLGCVASPGTQGVDIVTCEAQPLGLPLSAGGPYLGAMATRTEYESRLPGRIVGICNDLKGEPALALVKEEREQHVSRDKATSHICSNQAHMALRVLLYLSTVGERGFRRISSLNAQKAHYLHCLLTAIPGVRRVKSGEFFNEFLVELPCEAAPLLEDLRGRGIFGGIDFAEFDPSATNQLLIAVTETKSRSDLDRIAGEFSAAIRR